MADASARAASTGDAAAIVRVQAAACRPPTPSPCPPRVDRRPLLGGAHDQWREAVTTPPSLRDIGCWSRWPAPTSSASPPSGRPTTPTRRRGGRRAHRPVRAARPAAGGHGSRLVNATVDHLREDGFLTACWCRLAPMTSPCSLPGRRGMGRGRRRRALDLRGDGLSSSPRSACTRRSATPHDGHVGRGPWAGPAYGSRGRRRGRCLWAVVRRLATASGLTVVQACALSVLMFTGGSQFALIGVLAAAAMSLGIGVGHPARRTKRVYGARLAAPSVYRLRRPSARSVIDESTAVALASEDRGDRAARLGFWATGLAMFVLWNLATRSGRCWHRDRRPARLRARCRRAGRVHRPDCATAAAPPTWLTAMRCGGRARCRTGRAVGCPGAAGRARARLRRPRGQGAGAMTWAAIL